MFRLLSRSLQTPSFPSPCKSRYFSTPKSQTRPFSSSHIRPIVYVRFSSPNSPRGQGPWGRENQLKVVAALCGVAVLYYVAHLEQVPETGRWRFMNTSPRLEAKITQLAIQDDRERYGDITLPPNHLLSRHVHRVVSRILSASTLGVIRGGDVPFSLIDDRSGGGGDGWNPYTELEVGASGTTPTEQMEWDVMVVNNPKIVNAHVVPGHIVIFTGILPICQDEQGLAAVISHEIGHVVARHTAERLSSQTVYMALMFLFQWTLGIGFDISGLMHKLLIELPNSRTQELEADKIGLSLMARACFDPRAAPEMFVRLGRLEAKIAAKAGLDFLQTHPSSASRVRKLEELLPDAYAVLAASPGCGAMQDQLQLFRATTAGHVPEVVTGGPGDGEMF